MCSSCPKPDVVIDHEYDALAIRAPWPTVEAIRQALSIAYISDPGVAYNAQVLLASITGAVQVEIAIKQASAALVGETT